jgi:pimeloyl-ACP methyl ester carboxylesterase
MKLHFKEYGTGAPLVILHGLFGMLDNWQYHARRLSAHFRIFALDARNHGHSPHDSVFTYEAMADDLLEFAHDRNLLQFGLLGHSMGGKTAMYFAQHHPEYVSRLLVADIGPQAYPVHHREIIEALKGLDFSVISSRGAAQEALASAIPELGVRQFLLKSLYWADKGRLSFRFNLDAIDQSIEEVGKPNYDRQYFGPTLFLRGENSKYILPERDEADIKSVFPDAEIQTIADAGHWLHADQPDLFCLTAHQFFSREA